jgi:hypothetical protein
MVESTGYIFPKISLAFVTFAYTLSVFLSS